MSVAAIRKDNGIIAIFVEMGTDGERRPQDYPADVCNTTVCTPEDHSALLIFYLDQGFPNVFDQ